MQVKLGNIILATFNGETMSRTAIRNQAEESGSTTPL